MLQPSLPMNRHYAVINIDGGNVTANIAQAPGLGNKSDHKPVLFIITEEIDDDDSMEEIMEETTDRNETVWIGMKSMNTVIILSSMVGCIFCVGVGLCIYFRKMMVNIDKKLPVQSDEEHALVDE